MENTEHQPTQTGNHGFADKGGAEGPTILLLDSNDGFGWVRAAIVPPGMDSSQAQARAGAAIEEFSAADRAWCDANQEGDQPRLDDYLKRHGFVLPKEILHGPQWD